MGNYIFSRKTLEDSLVKDSQDESSKHDLGTNIIPMLANEGLAYAYDFHTNVVPGETERDKSYWRDVGSIDSYYDAHMDLVSVHPIFNLYNRKWPLLTNPPSLPPAKFSENGSAVDSIVGAGTIIAGGRIERSVISSDVITETSALVQGSVIMPSVRIGKNTVIRNAIIDKNVVIESGAQVGVDLDRDKERFTISQNGIIVVGKGNIIKK